MAGLALRYSPLALGKSTLQRQVGRADGGSGDGSHPVCSKTVRARRPRSRRGTTSPGNQSRTLKNFAKGLFENGCGYGGWAVWSSVAAPAIE